VLKWCRASETNRLAKVKVAAYGVVGIISCFKKSKSPKWELIFVWSNIALVSFVWANGIIVQKGHWSSFGNWILENWIIKLITADYFLFSCQETAFSQKIIGSMISMSVLPPLAGVVIKKLFLSSCCFPKNFTHYYDTILFRLIASGECESFTQL
jgi:hypothetical protein